MVEEQLKRRQLESAALTAEETAGELERLHSQAEKQRDILQWDLDRTREKKFRKEHELKKITGNKEEQEKH